MKKILSILIIVFACGPARQAYAQYISGDTLRLGRGVTSLHSEGPCVTTEQWAQIHQTVAANRAKLIEEGKLEDHSAGTRSVTMFDWPLRQAAGFYDFDIYYIQNYVDHDPNSTGTSSSLQDYNCGTRTYDLSSGYDHAGTDICLTPYPWNMMDEEHADIIAAAPRVIVAKGDGNYDRNCDFNTLDLNYIAIEHDDGTVAYYFHMKNATVTSKDIGETVQLGEFLGHVGSSGSSTAPHLHFEVQDASYNVIDPWAGSCNNISSRWNNQRPYYDPAIVSLKTHDVPPINFPCPQSSIINESNHFTPGDYIEFRAYFRDLMAGYPITFNIYNPSGTLKWTGIWIQPGYQNNNSYSLTEILPSNASSGTWKFNAIYNGVTYSHYFTVNCTPTYTLSGSQTGHKGFLAGDHITSTATIPGSSLNQVTYEAENYIKLGVGFTATQNCLLLARIDACNVGGLKTPPSASVALPSENNIEVFPNPFSTGASIQLSLAADAKVSISVLDVMGKEILLVNDQQFMAAGIHSVKWAAENFPAGVYFIKARVNNESMMQKIVKVD